MNQGHRQVDHGRPNFRPCWPSVAVKIWFHGQRRHSFTYPPHDLDTWHSSVLSAPPRSETKRRKSVRCACLAQRSVCYLCLLPSCEFELFECPAWTHMPLADSLCCESVCRSNRWCLCQGLEVPLQSKHLGPDCHCRRHHRFLRFNDIHGVWAIVQWLRLSLRAEPDTSTSFNQNDLQISSTEINFKPLEASLVSHCRSFSGALSPSFKSTRGDFTHLGQAAPEHTLESMCMFRLI